MSPDNLMILERAIKGEGCKLNTIVIINLKFKSKLTG